MLRKFVHLSLALALILSLSACGTIADSNLEAVIRVTISKSEGPIFPTDLEGLTSLNASKSNITSLAGLEHCTNLTELRLDDNQIGDISPLAPLPNLEEI